MTLKTYEAACHCGAIACTYLTAQPPERWSIRACQCAFCRSHGALSTSDPRGRLEFRADDPDLLQRYRFALKTADFLLCRNCGVYLGAVIESDAGRFGILNTHALTQQPENLADVAAISYDGEDTGGRVARREERWTPVDAVPW
jgi:hypothetical protein